MAIVAILDLHVKPHLIDEAKVIFDNALEETRAFPGSLGVDLLIDLDHSDHWIVHELWESVEHNKAYRTWRAVEGKGPGWPTFSRSLTQCPVTTRQPDIPVNRFDPRAKNSNSARKNPAT